jgi:hypothetical protein
MDELMNMIRTGEIENVVRLKNVHGISDLVEDVYKGRFAEERLKNSDFLINHTDAEFDRFREMVADGVAAEHRVIMYVDTFQIANNPRIDRNRKGKKS